MVRNPRNHARGQALLIIVLVLAVGVTVGLSLIGRTTSDTAITGQIEDSTRAFSAAEAGIEIALKTNSAQLTPTPYGERGALSYATRIDPMIPGANGYPLPAQSTTLGNVGTIYLVEHNADGTLNTGTYYTGPDLTVCFRQVSASAAMPALEAALYFIQAGTYAVNRVAYDPNVATRVPGNGFSAPILGNGCGQTNVYSFTLPIPAGVTPLFVRVRPYYASAAVYFQTGGGFPLNITQAQQFTSVGTAPGGVSRTISVLRQYRSPPSTFDFAVYSQSTFTR